MKQILAWLLARGGETSTWRGIAGVLTGSAAAWFLFSGDTDKATGAIAAGTAAIGLINAIRSEEGAQSNAG
jgi:hypothetical protein